MITRDPRIAAVMVWVVIFIIFAFAFARLS